MEVDGDRDGRRISQDLVAYETKDTFTNISNYFESAMQCPGA